MSKSLSIGAQKRARKNQRNLDSLVDSDLELLWDEEPDAGPQPHAHGPAVALAENDGREDADEVWLDDEADGPAFEMVPAPDCDDSGIRRHIRLDREPPDDDHAVLTLGSESTVVPIRPGPAATEADSDTVTDEEDLPLFAQAKAQSPNDPHGQADDAVEPTDAENQVKDESPSVPMTDAPSAQADQSTEADSPSEPGPPNPASSQPRRVSVIDLMQQAPGGGATRRRRGRSFSWARMGLTAVVSAGLGWGGWWLVVQLLG